MSRRTLLRRLPELERYGVVEQERHVYRLDTGELRRKPSTWLMGLRKAMPDLVLPQSDGLDRKAMNEARNEAWLEANGMIAAIARMDERLAEQPAEPPF